MSLIKKRTLNTLFYIAKNKINIQNQLHLYISVINIKLNFKNQETTYNDMKII